VSRKHLTYFAFGLLLFALGCKDDEKQKQLLKWQLSLDKKDKRPYGTYLASQSLKFYFPGATIETLPTGFRYNDMDSKMMSNSSGKSLLILQGFDFQLSKKEWNRLKEFINTGNEVIVFCSHLDENIEKELDCRKELAGVEELPYTRVPGYHTNENILSLAANPIQRYGYKGRSLKGYFSFKPATVNAPVSDADIPYIDTLGYANSKPNFIRYIFGDGHFSIHAAPLVLSNYFLLQPGNENYLTALWQTLPAGINRIYWDDYYNRDGKDSGIWILWRYPATRLALLLAIAALVLYVLFEGKRKQRTIPVIQPLKNDSVSFAETVGRLYYNKGNHTNLAEKMTQQFLEWVRTHYLINTNLINENFIHQLTIKSGQPEAVVRGLTDMIHEIKLGHAKTDDAYLYQLYTTIQQFYKNNRK
jgi:hypothetical protein